MASPFLPLLTSRCVEGASAVPSGHGRRGGSQRCSCSPAWGASTSRTLLSASSPTPRLFSGCHAQSWRLCGVGWRVWRRPLKGTRRSTPPCALWPGRRRVQQLRRRAAAQRGRACRTTRLAPLLRPSPLKALPPPLFCCSWMCRCALSPPLRRPALAPPALSQALRHSLPSWHPSPLPRWRASYHFAPTPPPSSPSPPSLPFLTCGAPLA